MNTKVAQLNLDEPQSLFIADAILFLAGSLQGNAEVYRKAFEDATKAIDRGYYTRKTVQQCVEMVDKLADHWEQ